MCNDLETPPYTEVVDTGVYEGQCSQTRVDNANDGVGSTGAGREISVSHVSNIMS